MVDLDPDRTLMDLGGLLMELQEMLHVPVDVAAERMLRPKVRDQALREAVQLWGMGEAARCLSAEFRERHADKTWSKPAGLRHVLVNHYFEIDAAQVWKVVEHDLAGLRKTVIDILG